MVLAPARNMIQIPISGFVRSQLVSIPPRLYVLHLVPVVWVISALRRHPRILSEFDGYIDTAPPSLLASSASFMN